MFTVNWFDTSEIKNNIHQYLNKNGINKILEIGCYEGAASCFFSNIFLNHDESFLYCVDPFDKNDETSPVYENIKERFDNNIRTTSNYNKIKVHTCTSDDFFKDNNIIFNFIYIDGSHLLHNIINDFNNSLKFCEKNGIIWMDDYLGGNDGNRDIKNVIDQLYENNKNKLEIIHSGYQIAFKVIK